VQLVVDYVDEQLSRCAQFGEQIILLLNRFRVVVVINTTTCTRYCSVTSRRDEQDYRS